MRSRLRENPLGKQLLDRTKGKTKIVSEGLEAIEKTAQESSMESLNHLLEKLAAAIPDEEKRTHFLQRARVLAVELSPDEGPPEPEEKGGETEE